MKHNVSSAKEMPPAGLSSGAFHYPVRDIPTRQRPRELAERFGFDSVSEEVLLAILLRSGVRGHSVIEMARGLLQEYGSLTAMARASVEKLRRPGLGKVKAQVLKAALELARRMADEAAGPAAIVRAPADAANLLREEARPLDQERFWVLLLNTKHALKCPPLVITQGLLDASLVHPREVFRDAISLACAALVLVHNHPSGDPTPSADDIRRTQQMIQAGRVIDIRVLDHVILGKASAKGGKDFFSLREAGLVDFS